MENKKNPSKNLDRFRFLFWNIGLILGFLITISAFEYRFYEKGPVIKDITEIKGLEIIEDVKTTVHKPPKPVIKNPEIIEIKEEPPEIEDVKIVWEIEDVTDDLGDVWVDIPVEKPDEIKDFAEVMPSPVGGMKSFYEYIGSELKYPAVARRLGIQGTVYVVFVVDKNGEIKQVEILKGIGGGCDEEAVRVVENAPAWNPGKQRGNPVSVRMRIPIVFKLK